MLIYHECLHPANPMCGYDKKKFKIVLYPIFLGLVVIWYMFCSTSITIFFPIQGV